MKIQILLIIISPIMIFSRNILDDSKNDSFNFAIINRISINHIIFGKDKFNKVLPINTSMIELYFGTPQAFFYSGFRVSTPMLLSSKEDQYANNTLQQLNSTRIGGSIGSGYGISFSKNNIEHLLKLIFNISLDIGVINKYFNTQHNQLIWGTEFLFRYQYKFDKKHSIVLGVDTGFSFHTEPSKDKSSYLLRGISLFYSGIVGFSF